MLAQSQQSHEPRGLAKKRNSLCDTSYYQKDYACLTYSLDPSYQFLICTLQNYKIKSYSIKKATHMTPIIYITSWKQKSIHQSKYYHQTKNIRYQNFKGPNLLIFKKNHEHKQAKPANKAVEDPTPKQQGSTTALKLFPPIAPSKIAKYNDSNYLLHFNRKTNHEKGESVPRQMKKA